MGTVDIDGKVVNENRFRWPDAQADSDQLENTLVWLRYAHFGRNNRNVEGIHASIVFCQHLTCARPSIAQQTGAITRPQRVDKIDQLLIQPVPSEKLQCQIWRFALRRAQVSSYLTPQLFIGDLSKGCLRSSWAFEDMMGQFFRRQPKALSQLCPGLRVFCAKEHPSHIPNDRLDGLRHIDSLPAAINYCASITYGTDDKTQQVLKLSSATTRPVHTAQPNNIAKNHKPSPPRNTQTTSSLK